MEILDKQPRTDLPILGPLVAAQRWLGPILDASIDSSRIKLVKAHTLTPNEAFRERFSQDVLSSLQVTRDIGNGISRYAVGAGPLDPVWLLNCKTQPTPRHYEMLTQGGLIGNVIATVSALGPVAFCASIGALIGAFTHQGDAPCAPDAALSERLKHGAARALQFNVGLVRGAGYGAAVGGLVGQFIGCLINTMLRWGLTALTLLAMGAVGLCTVPLATLHALAQREATQVGAGTKTTVLLPV